MPAEKPTLPTATQLLPLYFITVALLPLPPSSYVTNGVPSGAMANEM